jgi:hypothetical protein
MHFLPASLENGLENGLTSLENGLESLKRFRCAMLLLLLTNHCIHSQYKEINMFTLKRLPQSMIFGLGGLLLAALVAASFATLIVPRFMPHTALAAVTQTCAEERTAEHCDKQDPEIQGCAADAITNASAPISANSVTIGRVERRFSPTCRVWWGRVFDYRQMGTMIIGVAGIELSGHPDFVGDQYRIRYSLTLFDPELSRTVPEVVGTLTGGTTPPVTATIPAIVIPAR